MTLPNQVYVATTVHSHRPVMVAATLEVMCNWLQRMMGDCEELKELRATTDKFDKRTVNNRQGQVLNVHMVLATNC